MRIEQRERLRTDGPYDDATVVVRGGRDTIDQLRRHAQRTARAWMLDGAPLLGISVFGVLDISLESLLSQRFATFRTVHLSTVGRLRAGGFEILPTGLRPHFTIRLASVTDQELSALLVAFGPPRDNGGYGNRSIWREEG